MISFYTRDGRMLDLEQLKPEDIAIEEIANALSNQGRYNGQTRVFYSVAEHSVILCRFAQERKYPIETQKALLLHDASEAYCGDIVYHLKHRLPEFIAIEKNIIDVIFDKFELIAEASLETVHYLDRSICIDEMSQLMARIDHELINNMNENGYQGLGVTIGGLTPIEAREAFLSEARRLGLAT